MVSPVLVTERFELWYFADGGERGPVGSCDLYESRAAAEWLCGAVYDYLNLAVWLPPLDSLSPDAQDDLHALRRGLRAGGPQHVRVQAVRYGEAGDNQRGPDDDDSDDDSDDDTVPEPTDTLPPDERLAYVVEV